MESVDFLLESESEPESDFWISLESEPESSCTWNRASLDYINWHRHVQSQCQFLEERSQLSVYLGLTVNVWRI